MKKIINIILAAIVLGSATSCSDFLQKDPPSSPSQSIFWQKKSDFTSALAGCYSVMYADNGDINNGYNGLLSDRIPCLDGLSDNANTQYDEGTYGNSRTIAQGDLTSYTGGFVSNMYGLCYNGINRVHQVMAQLSAYTKPDITAEEKQTMMAECKALRGYFYSYLFQCFREVPLVTESLTMETMYQPKASRDQIYAQIIKDYNEAINELPDLLYSDAKVTGHLTASAVRALKARVMMFNGYKEGVADPAVMKEVVSLLENVKGYTLAPRTRDNFVSTMQLACPEIIWSVRYLAPNVTNSMDLYYAAWNTLSTTRDLINTFECKDGLKWGESPLTVKVDESLIYTTDGSKKEEMIKERQKLFENRDRRLEESISQTGILRFTEPEFPTPINTNAQCNTGFGCLKLIQPMATAPGYETISDADVVIVRYAHVLLMIAEAENEANGPTAKAYQAVNDVRVRSGQPALPAGLSKEQMRERIRNEWRVETCFEGLRYFQMKQWNIIDRLNGMADPGEPLYKKKFMSAFMFFPLPQGEIDKATGVLVQDPNYK